MKQERELAIKESIQSTLGVYPQQFTDKNGVVTKRTEYQQGWNDAFMEILNRETIAFDFFETLNEEQKNFLGSLLSDGSMSLRFNEEKKVILTINCNDLFYWACADYEEIKLEELDELKKYIQKYKDGVTTWCCVKRNMRPQIPIVESMIENKTWNEILEALPPPEES